MIFLTNISIAFEALRRSRTRTFLTMLGIIIGVASVVFILVLGDSIKHAITSQVANLNNNLIVVRPGSSEKGVMYEKSFLNFSPLASYATTTLTEQDVISLQKNQDVKHIAPLMMINGSVRHKNIPSKKSSILATTPDLVNTLKLEMTEGQFLDEETNRDTVVIGNQLAIDLYGTDRPIGDQIDIRGRTHTIIGILKKNKGPVGINGVDLNHAAIISLDDGKSFNQGIAQIQQINIVPTKKDSNKAAIASVNKSLLASHFGEKDYSVMSGQTAAGVSKQFYQFITTLTAIVASVSLLVGGIGIMNIMLVGVSERTREIGVRKSLGASNRHILWQFLIEALIMSISGGVIGVLVGFGAAATVSVLLGFIPIINWVTFGVAILLSLIVGALFGLAPAARAAYKDPIEALRQNS